MRRVFYLTFLYKNQNITNACAGIPIKNNIQRLNGGETRTNFNVRNNVNKTDQTSKEIIIVLVSFFRHTAVKTNNIISVIGIA